MKKLLLKYTNIVNFTILLAGFITIMAISYSIYGDEIRKDLEAIAQLTSSNIYSDISGEITKPVFVSLTMANDIFLKNWLENNQAQTQDLVDYLKEYKKVYGYDSFSVVSESTHNYYHFDGLRKKISHDDPFDVWYFNFIKEGVNYSVNVDDDEANDKTLTVFINSRVENSDQKLLGVVGVGVKMTKMQEILKHYEDNFEIDSFITDKNGHIKIHVNDDIIGKKNLTELYNIDVNLLGECEKWLDFDGRDVHTIIKYVPVIDSYLVVLKDTKLLVRSLHLQIFWGLIIICVISGILTISSSFIVNNYKKFMSGLVTTDELTLLQNRRAFSQVIDVIIKKHGGTGESSFFIFDVDNFKKLNDQFGHLFGDRVLRSIAVIGAEVLGSSRNIFRIGGDEFLGIIHGDKAQIMATLEKLREETSKITESKNCSVSISIGATEILASDTTDSLMERADIALYESKAKGRNAITYINF